MSKIKIFLFLAGNFRTTKVASTLKQALLSCILPKKYANKVPDAVSLVEAPCDTATNHLKVIYNKPENKNTEVKKKRIAVCSKGHTFPRNDKSIEIWLIRSGSISKFPVLSASIL